MSARHHPRGNGFTLVEMLVALAIFALLSGGALLLLRFSVAAEQTSREHTAALASARRFVAIWTADLAQAVARPARDRTGRLHPALETGGGALLQLTRSGWDNPEGAPRAGLQRVAYRWTGQALARAGYPQLDGAARDTETVLLPLAAPPRLRWRLADGSWQARWSGPQATALPVAVEITLQPDRAQPPLRLVTTVGDWGMGSGAPASGGGQ